MLVFEFLLSMLESFGISSVIAIILIAINRTIPSMPETNEVEKIKNSNIQGFDEIISELTKERLNQEIQISGALETKAGILIGSIGVIITVFLSIGTTKYFEIFASEILTTIPFILGISLLIIAFTLCIMILKPREKLSLFEPRLGNNFLTRFKHMTELKNHIKEQYIILFEETSRETEKDSKKWKLDITYSG